MALAIPTLMRRTLYESYAIVIRSLIWCLRAHLAYLARLPCCEWLTLEDLLTFSEQGHELFAFVSEYVLMKLAQHDQTQHKKVNHNHNYLVSCRVAQHGAFAYSQRKTMLYSLEVVKGEPVARAAHRAKSSHPESPNTNIGRGSFVFRV